MVDISILRPGDRVRIVDHWNSRCCQNTDGRMDHWLGTVMTVWKCFWARVDMEEDRSENDGLGWVWNAYCIEEIVDQPSVYIEDLI